MNWLTLIALASLLAAGNSVLDRRLMRGSASPLACATSVAVVGLPIALAGLRLVPPLPFAPALEAELAGLTYVAAVGLYYRLLQREAISIVVPLLRLATVETLLGGALVLHERLGQTQLGAVVLLVVGSGLLSVSRTSNGKVRLSAAIRHILPITTLLAASNVLLALAYHTATLWQGQVYEAAGMASSLPVLVIIGWSGRRRHRSPATTSAWTWCMLVIEQTIRMIVQLAPAVALVQHIPAALVSAAGGCQPLWVWLLARFLLGERQGCFVTLVRGTGFVIVLAGTLLLR